MRALSWGLPNWNFLENQPIIQASSERSQVSTNDHILTAGFALEFYYSIRGDASKHGTATKSELEQMAKAGTLRPIDLVWDLSRSKSWVPASTIKGLFPEPEPEKPALSAKAEAVEKQKAPAASRKPAPKKKSAAGPVVACLVAVGLLGGGFVIWKSMNPDGPGDEDMTTVTTTSTSTTQPAPQIDYGARLATAAELVDKGDLDGAHPIIEELIQQDDYRAQAFDLTRKLDPLKQWDVRRQQIDSMLMQGLITKAIASDIASEVTTMGKKAEMLPLLDQIMARQDLDGPAATSAVELYKAFKLNSQIYRVLMSFTQLALETNNADNMVAGARVLAENGGEEEAVAKLNKFTAVNLEAPSVHAELAGILATSGDQKGALAELKKAAKIDEALTKSLAKSDSRFDAMRDSWGFKRLVKD